jgi:hypothetical protein
MLNQIKKCQEIITFINSIYISKQYLFPFLKITTFLIALGTVSVMVHALSSSVAQFSLLSLSFLFTEIAVLSASHAVIVGFGGCSA